jgi:hypothetical protein
MKARGKVGRGAEPADGERLSPEMLRPGDLGMDDQLIVEGVEEAADQNRVPAAQAALENGCPRRLCQGNLSGGQRRDCLPPALEEDDLQIQAVLAKQTPFLRDPERRLAARKAAVSDADFFQWALGRRGGVRR